ncbi:MAG TPA: group III truncated hemoglobin, partial [Gemmatimonadaceae bacterium]|nr:group III truncated hemoglobin [Gemmatimonadaceae bacterium]
DRAADAGDATAVAPLPELRDEDLHDFLVDFYDAVARDELLAPYFAPVDMSEHIPVIADFWSTLVFHSGRYQRNAFKPHLEMPGLTPEHFSRWMATLERTVDERFAGAAATAMKDYGHRVAYSMQLRLGLEPFSDYRADARAAGRVASGQGAE